MKIRKIQKNANSDCINIPPEILLSAGLHRGDHVSITLTVSKKIMIQKVQPNPKGTPACRK